MEKSMNAEELQLMLDRHHHNASLTPFFGDLSKKCDCGEIIKYGGITSHSRVCKYGKELRYSFFKEKFLFEEYCPICGDPIRIPDRLCSVHHKKYIFCSSLCFNKAHAIVKKAESVVERTCIICSKNFFTDYHKRKTCSAECKNKQGAIKTTEWHKNLKLNDPEQYLERNEKISKKHKGKPGGIPWNKGLRWEEYLKYYLNKDGTSNLYTSLEKNEKFFKKTKPEMLFEQKLLEWKCNYQYSFFSQRRQFDFLVSGDDVCYVIEIDGDYWHKSRRMKFSEDDIIQQRKDDNEKGKLVNNLTSSRKTFKLLRVWEYHIYNNNEIFEYFKNAFKGVNINENVSKIEEYYQVYY
jgi:hypothetical protein